MTLILYLAFCALTFFAFFVVGDEQHHGIKKRYMILPPLATFIMLMLFTAAAFIAKSLNTFLPLDISYFTTLFAAFIASCTFALLLLVKIVIYYMLGIGIGFHRRFNSRNLQRNPVKFVIEKRYRIIRVALAFYFIGAVMMYYGILFKTNFFQ